jgi:ribosome-binding factor A
MSRRTEMLASTIQRELMEVIMRELDDPRLTGMPSITRVRVSEDLALADIYVTSMGTDGQRTAMVNALRHSAGAMRTKLTRVLALRQTPYLKFHLDEQYRREIEVLSLLEQVRIENEAIDRRRAELGRTTPGDETKEEDNA